MINPRLDCDAPEAARQPRVGRVNLIRNSCKTRRSAFFAALAMKRFYRILLAFFLIEGTAYAHGQEVILFPVGQVAAIILAIIVSIIFIRRWIERTIAILITVAVCVWAWFIPGTFFPESLHSSEFGYFFEGFVLPSIVTLFVALFGAIRRLR